MISIYYYDYFDKKIDKKPIKNSNIKFLTHYYLCHQPRYFHRRTQYQYWSQNYLYSFFLLKRRSYKVSYKEEIVRSSLNQNCGLNYDLL